MVEYAVPIGVAAGFALGLATAFFTKRRTQLRLPMRVSKSSVSGDLKLVLVVRSDLGMRKGKTAAQCAHAVIGCYKKALVSCPDLLQQWEDANQPKIILQPNEKGEAPLFSLKSQAEQENLIAHLIRDAGRTQVARHSVTVLGIGPGPAHVIDPIVNHLKLL